LAGAAGQQDVDRDGAVGAEEQLFASGNGSGSQWVQPTTLLVKASDYPRRVCVEEIRESNYDAAWRKIETSVYIMS
jgi:phage terminase large subunit